MKSKPNLCVDFDGVLNNYTGWKGEKELFTPKDGAKEFLEGLSERYTITIFTTRDTAKIKFWMKKYDMYYDNITNIKRGAVCYIDDRAILFNGDYKEILEKVDNFKAYWEE